MKDTRDGADTGPVTAPHEARSKLLTYGLNHDVARCRVMSRSMSRAGTAANLLAEHEFPEPSVMSRAVAQIRGYWSEPIF